MVIATFLPVIDYADILYMNASATTLQAIDKVYHGALRFITNSKSLTHHCHLYERAGLTSLSLRRWFHWHIFIYKAIIGQFPSYLSSLFNWKSSSYNLRSQNLPLFIVPRPCTEFGKKAFGFYAPWSWNQLQKIIKLDHFIPLGEFKSLLQNIKTEVCKCFI